MAACTSRTGLLRAAASLEAARQASSSLQCRLHRHPPLIPQVLVKPAEMRLHEALADHVAELQPDLCVFGSHRLGQQGALGAVRQ